jgi:peptide/nickel transport system ATP-binding protein
MDGTNMTNFSEDPSKEKPLISVEDLHVRFSTPKGPVHAVRGVSFDLRRERLGIVGESGSGKSQTGRALLRLTAGNGSIEAKKMMFDGMDLMQANEKTMRDIRGSRISMIMQDPKYSLNPVMTVGAQIAESCRQHEDVSKAEAKRRALAMLDTVRIREPEKVYNLYPHQVSGGMGQRIMIAMMLITNPEVMIADEPTSALDVTVQMQVLSLLDDMVRERGMGLVLISHDLHLVSSFCDRVLVMYGGRIMEILDAKNLDKAQHPYTKGLLNCLPRMDSNHEDLPVLKRDPAWLHEDVLSDKGAAS